MIKLETFYNRAYNKGIAIDDFDLGDTKKGACLEFEDYKCIALNKQLIGDYIEETEILAEEMAHLESGELYWLTCDHNLPTDKNNIRKCEAKAKTMAYQELVPLKDLLKLLDKCIYAYHELAERLEVSIHAIREAVALYEHKGLLPRFAEVD